MGSLLFTLKLAHFQADQNQAISMVSYYASSSEPAQVRGKTVYIQYSNRQEITNNKGTGDSTGNVLLVTFEGVQPNDVTIEVIHLVSIFMFVCIHLAARAVSASIELFLVELSASACLGLI